MPAGPIMSRPVLGVTPAQGGFPSDPKRKGCAPARRLSAPQRGVVPPSLVAVSALQAVCIDCADPWALGHWWAETLGDRVRPHTPGDVELLSSQGITRIEDDPEIAVDPSVKPGPVIWFNKVPEPKRAKNRVPRRLR